MKDVIERIIEAIVALVFGIVITVVGITTGAGTAIIVLGGLLTVVGIGCLVWAIIDKNEAVDVSEYEARISKLEAELADEKVKYQAEVEINRQISDRLAVKEKEIKSLKAVKKTEETKKESVKKPTKKVEE